MDVPSTATSTRSNRLIVDLLDSEHRLQLLQQLYELYTNVAYDLLPYNIESATLTIESNIK